AKETEEWMQRAEGVMLELQWIAEGGSQDGVPAPVAARRKGRERTAWIVAGVAIAACLGLAVVMLVGRRPAADTVRVQMVMPRSLALLGSPRISPDGRYVAFDGFDSTGHATVWVRPLAALTAQPLPSPP